MRTPREDTRANISEFWEKFPAIRKAWLAGDPPEIPPEAVRDAKILLPIVHIGGRWVWTRNGGYEGR